MFFSHETLILLLESRHKLYVQLGLIDRYVTAGQDGPTSSIPPGDRARMSRLIEALERQIEGINRQIAQFKGPILDRAEPVADAA